MHAVSNPAPERALPPGAERAEGPWLVADVGGTNARFGWVSSPSGAVEHVRQFAASDFEGPAAAAAAYREHLQSLLGRDGATPHKAAWAVATALDGDEVRLTNNGWSFSRQALERELGVQRLRLLNDFEALALSLPRLGPQQLRGHGLPLTPHGTLAVVGPGTGLGVAGVVETPAGWLALPGEGGHATLAPTNDFEAAVLQQARRHFDHVSAERLLSGIGLPVLHQAVAAVQGTPAPTLTAPAIVETASTDAVCALTLDTFCALLGSFCGNVALTLGARGGLYIGGGIVPRLGERFFQSRFREAFEAKGRFRGYLAQIPTALITDTLAALTGAAQALAQDP